MIDPQSTLVGNNYVAGKRVGSIKLDVGVDVFDNNVA